MAMTANCRPEDRELCERAGMDGCIVKPVRIDDLHAAIARWDRPVTAALD